MKQAPEVMPAIPLQTVSVWCACVCDDCRRTGACGFCRILKNERMMEKITKEQIAKWKAKYGSVFQLVVDGKTGYLHKPDRKTLSYASTAGQTDPLKFNEVLLKGCWLGGDEEICTDDELFLAASGKLGELIQVKEAELKKL